jgi:hypothetical protein
VKWTIVLLPWHDKYLDSLTVTKTLKQPHKVLEEELQLNGGEYYISATTYLFVHSTTLNANYNFPTNTSVGNHSSKP